MHLVAELIRKVDLTDFTYTKERMRVISDVLRDPGAVNFIELPNIKALMAKSIPNPFFNRIMLSSTVIPSEIEQTIQQYQRQNVIAMIEISPGAIDERLSAALFAQGYSHSRFHPIFLAPLDTIQASTPELEVTIVQSAEDIARFQDIYLAGWNTSSALIPLMKSYIEKWVNLSGWTLYLAHHHGIAISCAILYCFEDIAYLADATTPEIHRGKGGQTALLSARIADAQRMRLPMLLSRADFGSISQKNMEKLGLNVSYARSVWTKIPEPMAP